MGEIADRDRTVFAYAQRTVGLNFTPDELERITRLAEELKRIIDTAKKRMQEKLAGEP